MDNNKLDAQFKKAMTESSDFYELEANHVKDRIWNQVKTEKKSKPFYVRLLAVASILLLIFLSSSMYFNLKFNKTINQLVEANTQLNLENQELQVENKSQLAFYEQKLDTAYAEKKKSESQTIAMNKYTRDTFYVKKIVYVEKEKTSEANSLNAIASKEQTKNKSVESVIPNQDIASQSKGENNTVEKVFKTEELPTLFKNELNLTENGTESSTLVSNAGKNGSNYNRTNKDIIIVNEDKQNKRNKKKFKIKFGRNNSKIGKNALALSTKLSK